MIELPSDDPATRAIALRRRILAAMSREEIDEYGGAKDFSTRQSPASKLDILQSSRLETPTDTAR